MIKENPEFEREVFAMLRPTITRPEFERPEVDRPSINRPPDLTRPPDLVRTADLVRPPDIVPPPPIPRPPDIQATGLADMPQDIPQDIPAGPPPLRGAIDRAVELGTMGLGAAAAVPLALSKLEPKTTIREIL